MTKEAELRGDRVRARRLALRMTQERLAEQVDLTQDAISKIETGKYRAQLARTQEGLAKALDTSLAYLRGESDDPTPGNRPGVPADTRSTMAIGFSPDEGAIERALLDAFEKVAHTFTDVEAVRVALREVPEPLRTGRPLAVLARTLLDHAAGLRKQGQTATPVTLFWLAFAETYSAHRPA
jgi:transcriptional regulator with XRE-family HTH domain